MGGLSADNIRQVRGLGWIFRREGTSVHNLPVKASESQARSTSLGLKSAGYGKCAPPPLAPLGAWGVAYLLSALAPFDHCDNTTLYWPKGARALSG